MENISFRNIVQKWCDYSLILRILIVGLGLGIFFALFFPQLKGISILGTFFVGGLKAIAPFLVFLLVSSSLSKASDKMGSKFRTCIILYFISMFCAALVAVSMSFLFPLSLTLTEVSSTVPPVGFGEMFSSLILNIISNPIDALLNGEYLSILFWAVVLGLCFRKVANNKSVEVLSDCADAVSLFVRYFVQLAPFGVMGLVFTTVTINGISIFTIYGKIILLGIVSILIVAFVTDPLISGIVLRRNPYPLVLKCFKESGIPAFFTRSSAANIPINLRLCEKLGLDKDFYSVTIPLGATINMEGATVNIAILTLALCHTLGVGVSFPSAVILCVVSAIAACGVAAVPNGSLLLIPMAASLFGISNDVAMQAVAVGFITAVIQDSFDTALNSSGDVIFSATTEYYERKKQGKEVNFLGEFAKN